MFEEVVVIDVEHRVFRIARDPATAGELVQEAPGYFGEHECTKPHRRAHGHRKPNTGSAPA